MVYVLLNETSQIDSSPRYTMPLISIISVVKDDFKALSHTRVGVLSGFTDNIEWIIVDGTPDRRQVELIVGDVSFPVKIISEPDKGPYDAMNKGTAMASGEWLLYTNAGDRAYITTKLLEYISAAPADVGVVYADTLYAYKNRVKLKKVQAADDFRSGMPFCHQSVLFSGKLKSELVYNTAYKYAADYDLLLSLKNKSVPMAYYPSFIAEVDPYGISNRHQFAVTREQYGIAKKRGFKGGLFYLTMAKRFLLAGLADFMHVILGV